MTFVLLPALRRLGRAAAGLCCLLPLIVLAQGAAPAGGAAPASPATATAEATLEVANRQVVTFRADYNGASPQYRVRRAEARLEEARGRRLPPQVDLVPITNDRQRGVAFRQGDVVLFTLTEADLEAGASVSLEQAAQTAQARLLDALRTEEEQWRWPVLARGLGLAALETALLALLLWGLWRLTNLVEDLLARRAGEDGDEGGGDGAAGQPARALTLMQYTQALVSRLVQLVALFVSAALVFGWVTTVMLAFPSTQPLGERLTGLFTGTVATLAEGALRAVPGLVVVAVIVLLAQAAVETSNALFRAVSRRELKASFLHPETASATRRLVALAIWALALVAAYPHLPGSNSDVFKGVSVLLGAMITLGSSGVVNQLMSGLVLVYSRALRVGDHVVIGKQGETVEGVVQEVGTLATKVMTMRNEEITIPNAVLVSSPIRNYSRLAATQGTMVSSRITIGYDTPWRQVHQLLEQAAGRASGLRQTPAPFVLQRALGDFYVEYELFAYIDRPLERIPRLSELHQHIQDCFAEAGVTVSTPHLMEISRRASPRP